MASTWIETLVSAHAAGAALTNSTTPTSLLPTAARFTFPNSYFRPGQGFSFRAKGIISTLVTTPGTLTFSVRLGTGPVIAATSDALALNIVSKTNRAWEVDWDLDSMLTEGGGTSSTLTHNGWFISEAVVGAPLVSVGGVGMLPLLAAGSAAGTGFDGTAAQIFDFFATWSVANAGNSIQLQQAWLTGKF